MKEATIILAFGLFGFQACGPLDSPTNSSPEPYANLQAFQNGFPDSPDATMTPGHLCQNPDSYKYPQKIKYCERRVSSKKKDQIVNNYDKQLGYHIAQLKRKNFKIDHYIPLCIGGSNEAGNLWPQHFTVYQKTDPVEQPLCTLLSRGDITQAEAVQIIKHAKNNLDECDKITADLKQQLR